MYRTAKASCDTTDDSQTLGCGIARRSPLVVLILLIRLVGGVNLATDSPANHECAVAKIFDRTNSGKVRTDFNAIAIVTR